MTDWQRHASRLAATAIPRGSRWREPVMATPRHQFVPHWWDNTDYRSWSMHDGPADVEAWMDAAYSDTTLVTQVAGQHADHAPAGGTATGWPTSSSTLPGLVVRMLGHADVYDGADVLDVATGSGYSAALLCHRLGAHRVTTLDVDPYLVQAAAERLAAIGHHPKAVAADARGPLPDAYDRIVSMVSVRPIPASWMTALRPGGRLVTVLAETCLIITAEKRDNGWAEGRVEWDRAMFMKTRDGGDYPPGLLEMFRAVRDQDGDEVGTGHYPIVKVVDAWDLQSMLEVTAPGIEHYHWEEDGVTTAVMVHADGSWARAESTGQTMPVVHQSGPRRLWAILDEIRDHWLRHGELPVHGAWVWIAPDGTIQLQRGQWKATLG